MNGWRIVALISLVKGGAKRAAGLVTEFFKNGAEYTAITVDRNSKVEGLEPKVYELKMVEGREVPYIFELVSDKLPEPEKIFGKKMKKRTQKILFRYEKSDKPTGVILGGGKGTGKTKQAAHTLNEAAKRYNIPIIKVTEPMPRHIMEAALTAASPCCLDIDEMEKLYKPEYRQRNTSEKVPDENELLTLFSNPNLGKVLTVITTNNVRELSPFMLNRPERFYFRINYKGTEEDVVKEICADFKLNDKFTKFLAEYAEDNSANIDSILTLAESAVGLETTSELIEDMKELNVIKPKTYKWIVYTKSGKEEQYKFEAERKELKITDTITGKVWELNHEKIWRDPIYRRNHIFNCLAIDGAAGESLNLNLGVIPNGASKQDDGKEDEEIITFQPLQQMKEINSPMQQAKAPFSTNM